MSTLDLTLQTASPLTCLPSPRGTLSPQTTPLAWAMAVHAALWDYAQKKGIVIEGLKPPVEDVDELEHEEEEE